MMICWMKYKMICQNWKLRLRNIIYLLIQLESHQGRKVKRKRKCWRKMMVMIVICRCLRKGGILLEQEVVVVGKGELLVLIRKLIDRKVLEGIELGLRNQGMMILLGKLRRNKWWINRIRINLCLFRVQLRRYLVLELHLEEVLATVLNPQKQKKGKVNPMKEHHHQNNLQMYQLLIILMVNHFLLMKNHLMFN